MEQKTLQERMNNYREYGHPLFRAARAGDAEGVRACIEMGFSVNQKDKDGCTAGDFALRANSVEVLKVLIENNFNVDARAEISGTSLLMKAVGYGNFSSERAEFVKCLIEGDGGLNRPNIDGIDSQSMTPLMLATLDNGGIEAMKILVEAGANVNKGNPLRTAAIRGDVKKVKYLLEAGADSNIKGTDGMTTLMGVSVYGSNGYIVKLLIEKGADVHANDNNGHNALYYAKRGNNKEFVEIIEKAMATTKKVQQPKKITSQQNTQQNTQQR